MHTCLYEFFRDQGSVIGGILALLAGWLVYRVTRSQFKLAREEFISTHRPKISVRAFRLHLEDVIADHKYAIEFVFLNEGVTRARVTRIKTRVFQSDNPWTYGARKVHFDDDNERSDILAAGEGRQHITKKDFSWDAKEQSWFCIGIIEYIDDRGVKRETGFCRKWKPESMEWHREKNEDYEYSY